MGVDLHVGNRSFVIGSSSFFFAFFSTIVVRLENNRWASRFPIVMNSLYSGTLSWQHAKAAVAELQQIREELKQYPPTQVVWDCENPAKPSPWGNDISNEIMSLSDYFVTSDGKDLFEVLFTGLNTADKKKCDATIM